MKKGGLRPFEVSDQRPQIGPWLEMKVEIGQYGQEASTSIRAGQ